MIQPKENSEKPNQLEASPETEHSSPENFPFIRQCFEKIKPHCRTL